MTTRSQSTSSTSSSRRHSTRFLNHCRLSHKIEFPNHEEALLNCGTPVDESVIPPEHPARSRAITRPPSLRSILGQSNFKDKRTTYSHNIPSACTSVFDPIGDGSRFYVKRRIVVGNVSKWIAPEKRDPKLQKYTHKWMVYVTGPPHDLDITSFIQRVRYFLHPSYRPLDIVDVTESPFQLIRYGWGEFPIKIQLNFVDKKNKPVYVIHELKLDDTHSGKQILGKERAFDIELDRNTQFIFPENGNNQSRRITKNNSIPDVVVATASKDQVEGGGGVEDQVEVIEINEDQVQEEEEGFEPKEKDRFESTELKLLEPLLNEAVQNYPLIISISDQSSRTSTLPYTTSTSIKMFLNWDREFRKKVEWQRARLIRLFVQSISRTLLDSKVKEVAALMTTKQVIFWCRDNRHTPLDETKKTKLSSLTLAQDFLDEFKGDNDVNMIDEQRCPYEESSKNSSSQSYNSSQEGKGYKR
ncbi:5477_t:CDS:2 [Diversispora eburnea]|uniref:Protein AF-9 homolog n=1 Tax=Diversispora eburnea TaxID=1213867 RepID=A0A9N9A445_9GLOM|nr:5477_t:CDS:2 [Diversispora eburnea]